MIHLAEIDADSPIPKYQQIVDAVSNSIKRGNLKRGQRLMSINEFSDEFLVSRVTVEKAYGILKEQGIITSTAGKGYYINKTDIDVQIKVLLIFNKISNYKKDIYTAFLKTLGTKASVDLKIHHFNPQILKSLVENQINDYDYFVIMPHFYDNETEAIETINSIPAEKLLLLDKKIPGFQHKCGAVYQDFENDIINALYDALPLLHKYLHLVMVHSQIVPSPPEKITGFKKFCMQNRISNRVIHEINEETVVSKGNAYIVTEDTDLANLIKNCLRSKLKVGSDIGIISYNETPLKEILLDGITVISTDHARMGSTAARLLLSNSCEQVKNPFELIKRASL
jgi:DNA-binding transcriptional regulator YhcF (GntR family)